MSQISAWLVYAVICAGLVYCSLLISIGYLRSAALAVPNHRSGHTLPTPQGAGLVVIPVAVFGAAIPLWTIGGQLPIGTLTAWMAGFGALGLMLMGFVDDVRGIGIGARLAGQAAAVSAMMLALPPEFRVGPFFVPLVAERLLISLALLWFINVVNFMDGMDWMSAIETCAVTFGIVLLATAGLIEAPLGWCAAALLGAVIGFMPFNAHPARLFLGDAGSLPLGILLGFLLLNLAEQAPAAALLLPLYYIADASITLAKRIWRGQRFWEAHRQHFYHQALFKGWPVRRILAWIALTNAGLFWLALFAEWQSTLDARLLAIMIGVLCAGTALWALADRSDRQRI